MKVADFLCPEAIIPALAGATKAEVLTEMSRCVAARHQESGAPGTIDAAVLRRLLEERELTATTAIGDGIAIPHGKLDSIDRLVGALGRSPAGLAFDSLDGKPTHLVFMLVAPADSAGDHLKALARLSQLFRQAEFRRRLMDAGDGEAMYHIIAEEDSKH